MPLSSLLFRLEIVKFVITSETFHQALPTLPMPWYHLLLLLLSRVSLRVPNSLHIGIDDSLHLALPRAETLFHVVFLQKFHERLIHLVTAELLGLASFL